MPAYDDDEDDDDDDDDEVIKRLEQLTAGSVPEFNSLVHGASSNEWTVPVELCRADLCPMTNQRVHLPVNACNCGGLVSLVSINTAVYIEPG